MNIQLANGKTNEGLRGTDRSSSTSFLWTLSYHLNYCLIHSCY